MKIYIVLACAILATSVVKADDGIEAAVAEFRALLEYDRDNALADEGAISVESGSNDVTWEDCSKGKSPIKIKSLSVSPYQLNFPGKVTVDAEVSVPKTLNAPLKAEVQVWKKVLFWVKAGCYDVDGQKVGSCTYNDICSFLPNKPCPDVMKKHGIPCQCPFKQGTYKLPQMTFDLPHVGGVPGIVNGDFSAQVELKDSSGKQQACVLAYFGLHFSSKGKEEL